MSRSTLRVVAAIVLVLLGAPVAMHVVLHDLHDHHDQSATGSVRHGGHEHPVVSSPAPQVPSLTRSALSIAAAPAIIPATSPRIARAPRSLVAFGALRTDTDVGLQPLLSTFRI